MGEPNLITFTSLTSLYLPSPHKPIRRLQPLAIFLFMPPPPPPPLLKSILLSFCCPSVAFKTQLFAFSLLTTLKTDLLWAPTNFGAPTDFGPTLVLQPLTTRANWPVLSPAQSVPPQGLVNILIFYAVVNYHAEATSIKGNFATSFTLVTPNWHDEQKL